MDTFLFKKIPENQSFSIIIKASLSGVQEGSIHEEKNAKNLMTLPL